MLNWESVRRDYKDGRKFSTSFGPSQPQGGSVSVTHFLREPQRPHTPLLGKPGGPSRAFPKEPRENLQPKKKAFRRRRIGLRRGGRTRGTSESPRERLLPGGSQGQMRVSSKHLMTPSRESSRKSGLSGSQRSPSRLRGSATAAHPARVPPSAPPARPFDAAPGRQALPGSPARGASPPPVAGPHAPGAQLQPPPRLPSA